ncbi:hypothetical protein B0H13DRAFT_2654226 [Mycena leptocephala]|nr:hypothetical protein B0H13DRAFT_2654226 [Mycena leptocephala]
MSSVLIDHGTPPSIPTVLLPSESYTAECVLLAFSHFLSVVAGYAVFALVCIVLKVSLVENPNRAGFLALAQLPPVFLFASKNSPLTALLLGPGVDYTKLNYVHRRVLFAGCFLFLGALVHGSLWINNHLLSPLPILTQQKEASGVAALATLCLIVLTSVAPVRRWCYARVLGGPVSVSSILEIPFFVGGVFGEGGGVRVVDFDCCLPFGGAAERAVRVDVCIGLRRCEDERGIQDERMVLVVLSYLLFPAFFTTLCYHTLYAAPWIFPPARFSRRRPRALPPLEGRGGEGGVHALFGQREWESHPLSVCVAEEGVRCLEGPDGAPISMLLAAYACGDWSRAVHAFALASDFSDAYLEDVKEHVVDEEERDLEADAGANDITHETREVSVPANALVPAQKNAGGEDPLPGRCAYLILEGPYGTPWAGNFERVLLFAGGSGATFTLGVLDELVGRSFGGCRGSFSFPPFPRSSSLLPLPSPLPRCGIQANAPTSAINWFAPYLIQIATVAP